jgi:hypothetical protein
MDLLQVKFLKDKILTAALIGVVSTIPFELFTRLLLLFGLNRMIIVQMPKTEYTNGRVELK